MVYSIERLAAVYYSYEFFIIFLTIMLTETQIKNYSSMSFEDMCYAIDELKYKIESLEEEVKLLQDNWDL